MSDSAQLLSEHFLEMRWRCLSLAADMDRIQRAAGGSTLSSEPELIQLRSALTIVMSDEPNRAQRLQMLFSDQSADIR
jgi:hypothetical protein